MKLIMCAVLAAGLMSAKGTSAGAKKAAVTRAAERASGTLVAVKVTTVKGKTVTVYRKK
jgi:hypothetical protein